MARGDTAKATSSRDFQKEKTSQLVDQIFPALDEEMILEGDDFFSETETVEDTVQHVNFQLGSEYYAVDILNVREIIRLPRVSFLPSVSGHISGLINLRGNILPVINTHQLFGLVPSVSETPLIIIIEIEKSNLGFLVDSVSQVIELRKEDIDPPMVTLEGERTEYVVGEATVDGQLVAILDIHKLVKNEVFVKSNKTT